MEKIRGKEGFGCYKVNLRFGKDNIIGDHGVFKGCRRA